MVQFSGSRPQFRPGLLAELSGARISSAGSASACFTHLGMHLDSSSKTFGPDKMLLFLDYGLRHDWTRIFLEGFVRQAARLDVYQFHDGGESPNMAGVRLGTQGMRLGHYDDGISFKGPELFQWLHKVAA